ncbi:hypothetical protein K503DRAFT_113625 [Rhizopogon vinicolor AM-OR11-026]|uniref:Uncharacterized protein n=1 Tax=Rhizopogon vinicolor AM-OR11-026 TaxID=1314800 RepID=A0A1B7N2H9_9AGAM|nr:hypothetical protein K503DRAFT_113625 [Rhizopogon vinicolor AM-OR11-026]
MFRIHIRGPPTSDSAEIKPLRMPFLVGATQFNLFRNGGSDHDDPFTWTRLPSSYAGTYDEELADIGAPQHSMFDKILTRADRMQYAAVRMHDPSACTHSRINPCPSDTPTVRLVKPVRIAPPLAETPTIRIVNTASSTTPLVHGGRSSAVYVPWRLLEGEVQRPARAWLDSPGGAIEAPWSASFGDNTRKYEVAGNQVIGYASASVGAAAETPRTPASKHSPSPFSTPRRKNIPPFSSPSCAQPYSSPSTPTINTLWSPPQSPGSPSPLVRSAVPSIGLPSTHDRGATHRQAQACCR